MPVTIPSTEPQIIRAGETVKWYRSLSDYSAADGYTLMYYLTGPSDITLTSTAYNTSDHLISEDSATTTLWSYGIYKWEAYAEGTIDGTAEKWFVGSGFITVKTSAGKSFAKTMLDAIESILEGRSTSKDLDLVAKNLGGTGITRKPELLMEYRDKFRQEYLSELENERAIEGKDTGRLIRYRFRNS